MRIGIDARLVYYRQAGIGQYILRLTEALAGMDQENEFVLLQSRKHKQTIVDQLNFKRVSLWTPSHHRLEQWTLPLEIYPWGLNLLHSPDFIPPFRRNCKSVITVHDLAFLFYPNLLTQESARYYGQIDQAVRNTDHIIAVSKSTKRDIIHRLGVPEDKITVIYEAAHPIYRPLDEERLLHQRCPEHSRRAVEGVKEKYHLPDDFILFVSTIEPRKNVPALLRAYRQLLDGYKRSEVLVLAGERGWLFEEVFALVEELGLESKTLFLGRVPIEDLLYLYNAAQLLVHPTVYEGFGLPPLEAMACGTPVVVSNVSSLPEIVGDAALLVDPENVSELTVAIWRLLTDEDLRADMSEKGLRRAAHFSWEKAARETLAVYLKVGGGQR
jgi:glycosyltransferase involved in cell wall biosynthesis